LWIFEFILYPEGEKVDEVVVGLEDEWIFDGIVV
jgi:hypothetical protein